MKLTTLLKRRPGMPLADYRKSTLDTAERVAPARAAISDPRYVFSLTARENWIIGP